MTDQAMSPLRRRMIEDMTIRKFAPKTQHDYLQRVKNFAAFLGRSPDTASAEDVRRYQLHLTARGGGVPTLNQTVSTLRFFFKVTLGRADLVERTAFVREPRKLSVGMSQRCQEETHATQQLHALRSPRQPAVVNANA
jgi:integrase/recombinase XerD